MNILLVANSGFLMQVLALLYSIFETNPVEINIYFCYSDMREREVDGLVKFAAKWEGKRVIPVYIDPKAAEQMKTTKLYPSEIYYRIFAIELLPKEMDKILYLDADMIVKGSLESLYRTDLKGYAFAACEDIYGALMGAEEMQLDKLAIPENYRYINSGMLLFNLDYLREDGAVAKLSAYIRNAGEDIALPDQDALNALYYDKIRYVPWERYNCPPMTYIEKDDKTGKLYNYIEITDCLNGNKEELSGKKNRTNEIYEGALIVHFAGTRKPWIEEPGDVQVVRIFGQCYYEMAEKAVSIFLECIKE